MLLIVLPLLALSFVLAMLSANLLLFLIPPARQALAAEAGDNPKLQFTGSQKALLKAALITATFALPIALAAAWSISACQ